MPAKSANYLNLTKPSFNRLVAKRHKLQKNKGFTLIELLIVVAIIGILSTVVLANYNNFGARQSVKNAAAQLKSELRKYQNFAISGQKRPDPNNTTCTSTSPERKLDYYWILSSPSVYRAIITCSTDTNVPSNVLLSDTFPWSGNIIVSAIGYEDSGSVSSCPGLQVIQVRFMSTNQGVSLLCGFFGAIDVSDLGGDRVYFELTNSDNSVTYRVFVTYTGEIYDERQP